MRLSMGIHPLPGSLDNTIHIYSAHGLTKKAEPKEDPMEKMEIVRMPFRQVYEEVLKGKHLTPCLLQLSCAMQPSMVSNFYRGREYCAAR